MSSLKAPCPIADHHDFDQFSRGVPALDNWLKKKARSNNTSGGYCRYQSDIGLCDF
jgi:hypothetical protein